MEAKAWMLLRVFINKYNPKAGNALLKFLPQEDAQTILSQDIRSSDISPLLKQPQETVNRLHYSWIQHALKIFPKSFYPIILGSLNPLQVSGLSASLSTNPTPVSKPVKSFIINRLYSILKEGDHLPFEHLPETILSPLGKWNKKELVTLIDFLGLHDLAAEIRHIVKKNYLENIYSCLTPKQTHYLKVCLYQKEKLSHPKLGINPAERNPDKLKKLVHQRGLVRLGKALSGQHPDLVWYIAHTLDIGRGKMLLQYYKQPSTNTNVTSILRSQVTNLINFLKKGKQ